VPGLATTSYSSSVSTSDYSSPSFWYLFGCVFTVSAKLPMVGTRRGHSVFRFRTYKVEKSSMRLKSSVVLFPPLPSGPK
jgi:hypothetical protein